MRELNQIIVDEIHKSEYAAIQFCFNYDATYGHLIINGIMPSDTRLMFYLTS
jgi:hypothetical protein